jgi:hypothetical protein
MTMLWPNQSAAANRRPALRFTMTDNLNIFTAIHARGPAVAELGSLGIMSAQPIPYAYTQKGRSVYSVLVVGFIAALAVLFFLSHDPIFTAIGVFFVVLVCSGIFTFLKGEVWSMSIQDGVLSWAYARWPKSSGRIELSSVRAIVIDDCSSALTITFADGSSQKTKLVGYGNRLRDYLASHYPQIVIKYVEGT